jgi:pyruvate/2-oxoacid:ferredoxin oxidoreductase alpha subunit
MKKVMVGNHAVAWGARLARVEVISAYPITPQTQVVEKLSEMCADGTLAARFIKVESEHSAMAAVIGASAAGVRTFTASSSHGLLYMHEMLHWAGGARLPVVMVNVNRAVGAPWNIWTDQNDSLAQRDTGWAQLYCEHNQEVVDTTIMAFKLAETLSVPVMLMLDGFYLSHTAEPVDIPDQEMVDRFLPKRVAPYQLDTEHPHAFGGLVKPDAYMEMRWLQQEALNKVPETLAAIEKDWLRMFGRSYGAIERYRTEDAELLLVTSGTVTSTARAVVDARRAAGEKIGLLKVKMFRPFPSALLREAVRGLRPVPRLAVLDRNISPGHGGIFAEELRSALYDLPESERPEVFGFVLGLGGRDITPTVIGDVIEQTRAATVPTREDLWVGVNP